MERELKAAQAAKQERIREHEWRKAIEETEVRLGDSFYRGWLGDGCPTDMHWFWCAFLCSDGVHVRVFCIDARNRRSIDD